jgi:hypothetical protein
MPAMATGTILGMSRGRFFTILLIVLIGGFLIVKLRPYIAYVSSLVQTIRMLLASTIGLAASTSTGIVDKAAAGTDVIVDKLSGGKQKQLRLPRPVEKSTGSEWKSSSEFETKPEESNKNQTTPDKSKKQSPVPDDTTSSVQSKSGYCYVGEWKGVRSCVKVSGACESGKVFETESACVKK